jgi:hypothetical protein
VHDDLSSLPVVADLGDWLDTYTGPAGGTTPSVQAGPGNDTLTSGAVGGYCAGAPATTRSTAAAVPTRSTATMATTA